MLIALAKTRATLLLNLMILGSSGLVVCQLVQVGPPDPHYCDNERVQPNLRLTTPAHISGEVLDASDAAFNDTRLELRKHESGSKREWKPYRSVMTDAQGHFDLGSVNSGQYRLLVPQRAWIQPEDLACPRSACSLHIVLRPAPTDSLYSTCPVK